MPSELATIEGLDEVLTMLTDLPREIVARAWLKALQAGAKVMQEYLVTYTPETEEGERSGQAEKNDLPHLADSTVVVLELDTGFRGGIAMVGFGRLGHVALWVEYGHRLLGHRPNKRYLKMIQPHPFMVPAIEAAYEQTLDAFQAALTAVLTSEVPTFQATFVEAGGAIAWFDGEETMDIPEKSSGKVWFAS